MDLPVLPHSAPPPIASTGDDEFRLIADSAPVPMWVTDLDRHRSFVNRAYVDFVGGDYAAARDLDWRAIIHPDDIDHILTASVTGEASLGTFTLEGRYRRADGVWRHLESVSQPRWDANGRHIGFIGVAHDVTDARVAAAELRDRQAQLQAIVEQTVAGLAQTDLGGRFTLVNDRFCEIAGRSRAELLTLTTQAITHPDDLAGNVPLFERAVRDGTPFTYEKRYVRGDGSTIWVSNSVAVLRRESGAPYAALAVTLDITERREAQARQQLLIDELNHRVKNTLAIIQGIAQQTFKLGADPVAARGAFEGRLHALSGAHDLLTMRHWGPVGLRKLVEDAVLPHAPPDACAVDGPELMVSPRTAVSLSLALHELATNAVKYGALSTGAGRVAVRWSVEGGEHQRLRLEWIESGGPPVAAPERRGFGTRMIERGLASELRGEVRIDFAEGGLRCTVDAPLPSGSA